MTYFLP
ncbi:1,4-alpha-glucan-branching enzyme domain protein, partial [Vibrio parahaemolyticus V-223/04]